MRAQRAFCVGVGDGGPIEGSGKYYDTAGRALPADDRRLHTTTVQLSGQQELPRADNSSEGTAAWAQMQPSSSSSSSAAASASVTYLSLVKCVCVAFVAVAGHRYTYTVCTYLLTYLLPIFRCPGPLPEFPDHLSLMNYFYKVTFYLLSCSYLLTLMITSITPAWTRAVLTVRFNAPSTGVPNPLQRVHHVAHGTRSFPAPNHGG